MIRDHIISSFHLDRDDLDMAPFDAKGGHGPACIKLFGDQMDNVIDELNEALAGIGCHQKRPQLPKWLDRRSARTKGSVSQIRGSRRISP